MPIPASVEIQLYKAGLLLYRRWILTSLVPRPFWEGETVSPSQNAMGTRLDSYRHSLLIISCSYYVEVVAHAQHYTCSYFSEWK